jgi:hypothetical protein
MTQFLWPPSVARAVGAAVSTIATVHAHFSPDRPQPFDTAQSQPLKLPKFYRMSRRQSGSPRVTGRPEYAPRIKRPMTSP